MRTESNTQNQIPTYRNSIRHSEKKEKFQNPHYKTSKVALKNPPNLNGTGTIFKTHKPKSSSSIVNPKQTPFNQKHITQFIAAGKRKESERVDKSPFSFLFSSSPVWKIRAEEIDI